MTFHFPDNVILTFLTKNKSIHYEDFNYDTLAKN